MWLVSEVECQWRCKEDSFILDSGSSCLLAVEHTSVAKVFLLGKYCKSSTKRYSKTATVVRGFDVKLSNQINQSINIFIYTCTIKYIGNYLTDIFILERTNDIFIADSFFVQILGKKEVNNRIVASRLIISQQL